MADDHSLVLREAVITHLRADAAIAGMLGERVFESLPPKQPLWPYVRYATDSALPSDFTGISGAEVAFTLHTFVHGPNTDEAHRLSRALVKSLDGADVLLEGGYTVALDWVRTQLLPDVDPNDHHGVVEFLAFTGSA